MNKRSFIKKSGFLVAVGTIYSIGNELNAATLPKKNSTKSTLVHQVYFWLKKDLTSSQISFFETKLKGLLDIKYIKYGSVGKPGNTAKRPVVDDTYSYALLTIFDDVAGHDAYQTDPIHDDFIKNCQTFWERVQVYDASTF